MAARAPKTTKNGLGTRLSTERLVLRPPSEEHVGAISRALAKNARHLATVGPDVPSASLVVVAARVAAERAAFRRGAAFAFYAFARASRGAPSSPVTLFAVSASDGNASLMSTHGLHSGLLNAVSLDQLIA